MGAKMQRLEVVRGRSELLSHFSMPQENPSQVAGDILSQAAYSTPRCHQNTDNFRTDARKNAATRGGQRAL